MQKVNPKWLRHEALHTTSVVLDTANSSLVNHHYYESGINPEFNKQIDEAMKALSKAYRAVGLGKESEVKKRIELKIEV